MLTASKSKTIYVSLLKISSNHRLFPCTTDASTRHTEDGRSNHQVLPLVYRDVCRLVL